MAQTPVVHATARWLIIALVTLLSACSDLKYDLYEAAVDYERGKAGLSARTIEVNGRSIALLESNAADASMPTLILLHGFGANKDNWVRFASHLTDSYRVIALDLPGHGDSVKDASLAYDMDDQVGYVHEILAHLKVDRFHLAGNSMGGGITALYAATYPDSVLSAILFNPNGVHEHESEFELLLKEGKNPLLLDRVEDFETQLAFAMAKPPFIPWPITSVLAERSVANKNLHTSIFSQIRASASHDYVFQDELKKIKAPTLIIWGKLDRLLHYHNADIFEQLIPGSRKLIFDEIGHMPMIEIPEESAAVVREFTSSI